jgi:hypothetical protein
MRYIRYKHDQGIKIIITGSNASLLSKELGTKLTGRHIDYEIFPFSYKEYLDFTKQKATENAFNKYLEQGGFPEYLIGKNELILQKMFKDILARDIIIRHNIRQTRLLEEVAVFLLSNSAKIVSLNKLTKSLGVKSTNTLSQYLSYLEDSYILQSIPQYSPSIKKQVINPKKIYAIDTGFIKANTLSFSEDLGRILETVVFLHLRRKYSKIFYYKEKNECDFIIKDKGSPIKALQVCHHLTEHNKHREYNGLIEALEDLQLQEGLIITQNQEETLKIQNRKIRVIPAWKWMGS